MSLPKVRIVTGKSPYSTKIEIDGVPVQGCTGYAIRQDLHSRPVPVLLLRLLVGELEMDGPVEVTEDRRTLLQNEVRSLRGRLEVAKKELERERKMAREMVSDLTSR